MSWTAGTADIGKADDAPGVAGGSHSPVIADELRTAMVRSLVQAPARP